MGTVPEELGKAATGTIDAMRARPLALALLVVNGLFLGLAAYVLGQVAANARELDKSQMELIARMAENIRDCGRMPKTNSLLRLYPPPVTLPIGVRD